jgi:hypothetical protein
MTDAAHGTTFGYLEDRPGDGREEMRVFVGVDVSDVNADALEFLNLGESFAGDVFFANLAAEEGLDEVDERGAEGPAVGTDEGWDGFGVGDGDAVGKDDVAAYAEGWVGTGDGYGIVEGCAGGHEGCGGESAGLMELGDGPVDAWGETEVVGVNDETGRHSYAIFAQRFE